MRDHTDMTPLPGTTPLLETADLLAALDHLQKVWTRTRAGSGGFWALSGFDYQISEAILQVIRSQIAGGELVLMEVLSDIVRQEGGCLVVSQLKRTLSSGTVAKALEELWSIDLLATAETPALKPHLRYQIQAARRELKDIAASIGRWSPDEAPTAELEHFKARVSVAVSSGTRNESAKLLIEHFADPHAQATIDRFAGQLLRADGPSAVNDTAQAFRTYLAGLKASSTQREVDFRLWGLTDRPPQTVVLESDTRKAVRVGEKLDILDLVAGRLAQRGVYEDIYAAAEDWLIGASEASEKIPSFWIEGRSGAGKSAALLHLLAQMHAENPSRLIVWLGSRADRFGDAIRRFRDVILDGRQLVIAIDDPLSPNRQSQFVAAAQEAAGEWALLNGMAGGGVVSPPVLVCCGPTEQREFGEDTLYDELDITAHRIPKESPEDLEELAAWYERRTGCDAPNLDGDVLLVQRFFQWNKGDIRDFALRFRARLEGFTTSRRDVTVFDIVARILAFGRLYSDYPAEAFEDVKAADDDLSRALDQLASTEAHLTFEADGGGVRLTHPHLADAIYRQWFGRPADRPHRKRHLGDGLRASLARRTEDPEVRLGPLWAIARLVRTGSGSRGLPDDVRERAQLIDAELRDLLPELYAEMLPDMTVLTHAPVWEVLDRELELGLEPPPSSKILDAIDEANEPAKGLRLSCHSVLHDQRIGRRGLVSTVAMLDRTADWRGAEGLPWWDWSFVASDAARHGGAAMIVDPVLRLIATAPHWRGLRAVVSALVRHGSQTDAHLIARGWLAATEDGSWHWASLLRAVADKGVSLEPFSDQAFRFLTAHPSHPEWFAVWLAFSEGHGVDQHRLKVIAFSRLGLGEQSVPKLELNDPNRARLLGALLRRATEKERESLMELSLAWVEDSESEDANACHVLPALWTSPSLTVEARARVRERCLNWLESQPEHGGWSFVWHPLVEDPFDIDPDELQHVGCRWVERVQPSHSGWTYVWETLLKGVTHGTKEHEWLLDRAEDWLVAAPEQHGWAPVWERVQEQGGARGRRMLQLARDWLRRASVGHPSWRFVARVVLPQVEPGDPDRLRLSLAAAAWLASHIDAANWPMVLERAQSVLSEEQTTEFVAQAIVLIREGRAHPRPRVIRFILSRRCDPELRSELLGILAAWVPNNFQDREWTTAWVLLAEDSAGTLGVADLLRLASQWSEITGPTSPGWPFLWRTWRDILASNGYDREIKARTEDALTWLCSAATNHRRWYPTWNNLEWDRPDLLTEPGLIKAQERWLSQPLSDLQAWSRVMRRHRRVAPCWKDSRNLVSRVNEWLERAEGGERGWGSVWGAALEAAGPDQARPREIALAWLRSQTEHVSWVFVWKLMVRASRSEPTLIAELLEMGEAWAARTPSTDPDWDFVSKQLASMAPARPLSASDATALVEEMRAHSGEDVGRQAWSILVDRAERNVRLTAGAKVFMAMLVSLPGPDRAFSRLWGDFIETSTPSDRTEAAAAIAMKWLTGTGRGQRGWPWVWKDLWTHWPRLRDDLRSLGHDWLKEHATGATGAHLLRQRLFPSGATKSKNNKPPEPKAPGV